MDLVGYKHNGPSDCKHNGLNCKHNGLKTNRLTDNELKGCECNALSRHPIDLKDINKMDLVIVNTVDWFGTSPIDLKDINKMDLSLPPLC